MKKAQQAWFSGFFQRQQQHLSQGHKFSFEPSHAHECDSDTFISKTPSGEQIWAFPPPEALWAFILMSPPLLSVCVRVLIPGKTIVSETYGAPVLHRYLRFFFRMLTCLWVEQLWHHSLARLPQASDLGVISGATRLCDVLPRGHPSFLVGKWPQGRI